jgi:hypothetical protein
MDPQAGPAADPKRQTSRLNAFLLRVLHNPFQLRVVLMSLIFAAWFSGVSGRMSAEIDATTRNVQRERARIGLAEEVERLRAQVDQFRDRLPRQTDSNEWLQYMLAGARGFPIRLVMINTESVKDVGPYRAVVIKLDVEGAFADVDAFLRWLEANDRLFRVDTIHIGPAREPPKMLAQFSVLGVIG